MDLIRTERLVLRGYRTGDYSAWREAYLLLGPSRNAWDVGPFAEHDVTRAKFRAVCERHKRESAGGRSAHFGLFSGSKLVGAASLMEIVRGVTYSAYLGYRIYNPYWRQGFAREAVEALIGYAFTELGLHRLEAGVEPRNLRSIRLARALGFRREGTKKKMVYLRGAWRDLIIYAVTCEELGYPSVPADLAGSVQANTRRRR